MDFYDMRQVDRVSHPVFVSKIMEKAGPLLMLAALLFYPKRPTDLVRDGLQ